MMDQIGFHLLGLERGGAISLAACTGSTYVAMCILKRGSILWKRAITMHVSLFTYLYIKIYIS